MSLTVADLLQVTSETLTQAHYLRAVVKESFRLNPVSIGIGRIANQDFELRGFHIPKGVNALPWSNSKASSMLHDIADCDRNSRNGRLSPVKIL